MNTPIIKLHIYKNDANEKPIEKIGAITIAHIEDMQENLSQEEDVSDYMKELLNLKDYNELT
jgi:hypothetical protein